MSKNQEKSTRKKKTSIKLGIAITTIIMFNMVCCAFLFIWVINLQHQVQILTTSSNYGLEAIDNISRIIANYSQVNGKVIAQQEMVMQLKNLTFSVADEVHRISQQIQELKGSSSEQNQKNEQNWEELFNTFSDNMNNIYVKAKEYGESAKKQFEDMKIPQKIKKTFEEADLEQKARILKEQADKMWNLGQKQWNSMFGDDSA